MVTPMARNRSGHSPNQGRESSEATLTGAVYGDNVTVPSAILVDGRRGRTRLRNSRCLVGTMRRLLNHASAIERLHQELPGKT